MATHTEKKIATPITAPFPMPERGPCMSIFASSIAPGNFFSRSAHTQSRPNAVAGITHPVFKSERHKAKIAELVKAGKISQAEYLRMEKATGAQKLPERIHPKKEQK